MPRATIDGDRVRITGVRNFDYRSRNDFTVRYQEREIRLSHLTALDFFVSYWSVIISLPPLLRIIPQPRHGSQRPTAWLGM